MWGLRATLRHGQDGKQGTARFAQKMTRLGMLRKGGRSGAPKGVELALTCIKKCTAVAGRTGSELVESRGRGAGFNRLAQRVDHTKCLDLHARVTVVMHHDGYQGIHPTCCRSCPLS
jgi:hypothetical protein